MRKAILNSSTFLCAVIICAHAVPAFAQTISEGAVGSNAAGGTDQSGLQDIIVTAERRSNSAQNAPVAISVVSGAALAQQGVSTPADLSGSVPALEISEGTGGKSLFYLRGVGNFATNALSDGAVAFNFNDVYIGRSQGTSGFFYDLERVEVLKGPQGTLYGRNATGGAINVVPVAPKIGELGGYFEAGYGNYNDVGVQGALNAPLGDSVAMRVSANYARHDGYFSDGTSDQDDLSIRAAIRAELTPDLDVTVTGDYFSSRGKGSGSTIISNTGGRFDLDDRVGLSDPRAKAVYENNTYIFIAGRTANGLRDSNDVNIDNFGVSAEVNWNTPVGTLTVIPAYRETDSKTTTTQPGFEIYADERTQQFTMEARLASDDKNTLSYILGAYYIDEDGQIPDYKTNAQYNAAFQEYYFQTKSYAFFGRLNFRATPDLTLSLGGRYTKEKKAFQGDFSGFTRLCVTQTFAFSQCPGAPAIPFGSPAFPLANTDLSAGGIGPFPFAGGIQAYQNPDRFMIQTYSNIINDSEASYDKFTYRLGADWQFTPRNLLYASFETGFKSGGFFFSPAALKSYQPENIKAYTLGSKNSFLDNRLRINVEAFHWVYKNQQISHLGAALDPNTNQSVTIFPTENVGKATFSGAEIEIEALVTETTRLGIQVQYLDAKYDKFVYNVPANSPPQTGCSTAPSSGGATIALNCSGFRPPNAPEWVMRLSAEQTVPLSNGGEIVLNGSANFQTETLAGLEFFPVETQDAYWMANAAITYNAPDDRFFVSGYIRNAFNETVFTNVFPPPLTNGLFVAGLRSPRTYGIRAGFKF